MMVWSANLAYAIGLITSDGCLSKDGRHIDFTSKDLEQIKNFKKILELKNKIGLKYGGENHAQYYFRVQFGNVSFYRFLLSIGLMPNKSKILGKILIPDIYFADFLRGVFDGDGYSYSYWDKRWKSSFALYTGFSSASLPYLEWAKQNIVKNFGIEGKIKTGGRSVYLLMYAKNASITLFKKMYYDGSVICLKRKRFKIERALGIIQKQGNARVSKLVYEQS